MLCSEVQLPWLEHFTPFTQPTQVYTELHCTCCGSLVQKTNKGVFRSSQEESRSIMKHKEWSESSKISEEISGSLKNLQEGKNLGLLDWYNFLRKTNKGEDREKKYRPYRKGLARQLNQAHCSQRKQTDCYLNRQTIGAVGRLTQLLDVVAKSTGQLEGITGGLSQAQEVC